MSKIKVLARAVCREGSLLACRWLSSPCLLTWPFLNVCLWRVPELSLPLLLRPLILSYQSRAPISPFPSVLTFPKNRTVDLTCFQVDPGVFTQSFFCTAGGRTYLLSDYGCALTPWRNVMGEGRCSGKKELHGEESYAAHSPFRSGLKLMWYVKGLDSRVGGTNGVLREEQMCWVMRTF